MREVGIVGVGHTKFGKSDVSFLDMLTQAALEAMDDAGAGTGNKNVIDQVFVASMGAGMLNRISGSASALVDTLNIRPAMAECVENGPASGASAIKLGYMAIASGLCDCVLVVGGEMMRVVSGWEATDFVATMLHPTGEYPYGLTLPSFAGLFTRLCMEKYGVESRDLSIISVKNHENACHNPCAHIQRHVKLERISDPRYVDATSPMVADPLRQFDMCPVSDGAAAVLLVAKDKQEELGFGHKTFARIAGIASATDTHYVADRAVPTDLLAVRTAAPPACPRWWSWCARSAARRRGARSRAPRPALRSTSAASATTWSPPSSRRSKEGSGMEEMYAYKCDKCGKLHHPRYAVCQNPDCDGRSFTEEPLNGHCKLLTWTRVFNLPEGYMCAWLNFGIVQFDNGVTAVGQIGFDEPPEIGMDLVSTVGIVKEAVGKDCYGFIFQKP